MSDLERVWEDCLEKIEQGGATRDDCLARYPQHAAELRRMFAAADALARGNQLRPSAAFQAEARARLIEHMRAHPRARPSRRAVPVYRLAFAMALLLLLVVSGGTGLAQAAMPGDWLYDLKIASEQVWRAATPDPLSADLAIANRRVDEMTRVAGNPRAETIAREGYARALANLAAQMESSSREQVLRELMAQEDVLNRSGLTVPELNRLLSAPNPSPTLPLPTPALPRATLTRRPEQPTVAATPTAPPILLPDATIAITVPVPSMLPTSPPPITTPLALPTLIPPVPTLSLP
ncbi:MAG: hypothetical protein KGJ80_12600 [Chloroflexota bacterium]|nr:hypothetical protein [Chloroflexota bacterium]